MIVWRMCHWVLTLTERSELYLESLLGGADGSRAVLEWQLCRRVHRLCVGESCHQSLQGKNPHVELCPLRAHQIQGALFHAYK